jgi:hypothetical protein
MKQDGAEKGGDSTLRRDALSAIGSGMVAALATNPLDVVKVSNLHLG